MRILICDDDSAFLEELSALLQEYFHLNNLPRPEITAFHSGQELLDDRGWQDIIFLDIEMPGIGGVEAGNTLAGRHFHPLVIVITSYMDYLDDAMRFHVFRYLSKPLDRQRLFRNMDDALNTISHRETAVALKTRQGIFSVRQDDIILVEVIKRRLHVHTEKEIFIVSNTFNEVTGHLSDDSFFSPHKNCLVNLKYVKSFDHQRIVLTDGTATDLVRRKYQAFKLRYLQYLEHAF